ncbi:chorismate mutase [Paenibacillus vulneris]|uniref:chorismate mutase n=1 Tax=Paenibacillus vulneris TaxID=1133364 RepID=A0ABW3UGV0_9BACL|nr:MULTISPECIES: chorismate mutase [unclassified Paenibacillus]MBE1445956.1 chorismate mutase [Paenibacillus sp. OAS669]
MLVRGIRGATTVEHDEKNEVLTATRELLQQIIAENGILPEEIACVFITVTNDLTTTFPAVAIRQLPGWELVPLMCSLEVPVEGSLPKCIRLMVMANTEKRQDEIVHVYLKEAMRLRPDLSKLTKA